MARFYANENLPESVVVELRLLGHDVVTMGESGVRLHLEHPMHAGIVVCTFDPDGPTRRSSRAFERISRDRTFRRRYPRRFIESGGLTDGYASPNENTLDVIGARLQYLHDRLRQLGADVTGGLAPRQGLFEYASARANP